jgi:polyhydroxybutyrate depolymerase
VAGHVRLRLALALGCSALLTACAFGADHTTGPVAAGTTGAVDLADRPFRLHVPTTYDETPTALVVALHGWGGDGDLVAAQLGLASASEERGFLLALPEGTSDSEGRQFWNATDACCNADDRDVDDSAYLSRVIDEVSEQYAVDPARVYAVGVSNGGFMAHRLACDHADQLAAVVSFAGAQASDPTACTPTRGVSVLEVHGTADATIRFEGGSIISGATYPSAEQTVGEWVALDHCARSGQPSYPFDADPTLAGAETTRTSWTTHCDDGSEVALWTVEGGGHSPPAGDAFNDAVVAWLDAHARIA